MRAWSEQNLWVFERKRSLLYVTKNYRLSSYKLCSRPKHFNTPVETGRRPCRILQEFAKRRDDSQHIYAIDLHFDPQKSESLFGQIIRKQFIHKNLATIAKLQRQSKFQRGH